MICSSQRSNDRPQTHTCAACTAALLAECSLTGKIIDMSRHMQAGHDLPEPGSPGQWSDTGTATLAWALALWSCDEYGEACLQREQGGNVGGRQAQLPLSHCTCWQIS